MSSGIAEAWDGNKCPGYSLRSFIASHAPFRTDITVSGDAESFSRRYRKMISERGERVFSMSSMWLASSAQLLTHAQTETRARR